MSFFQGASNVRITGGEFNVVKGNYVVHNQSRHTSNVNSFNTNAITTMDSHNDHSRHYHGVDPPLHTDRQHQNPSGRNTANGNAENLNYFPPSTIHPMMTQPSDLPPGSRTQNFDSFNVGNQITTNAHNNYSQHYGIVPPPATRSRRRRRRAGQQAAHDEEMEEEDEPTNPSNSAHQAHRLHPYGYPPAGQDTRGGVSNQRGFSPQGGLPYINGHRPGTNSSAQFGPGDIQTMSPDMQRTLAQMMELVQKETAPSPEPAYAIPPHQPDVDQGPEQDYEEEGDEDDDSESDQEEMDGRDARMRDPLNSGMANLSLNEELRPAFSHVKSDPQLPLSSGHQSLKVPMARMEPRHSESTQNLPNRLREPFVANPPPNPQTPQATPFFGGSPVSAEFGIPLSAVQGGAIFNNINGDYMKVDNSVNTTNIGSGNTNNTLIKDSYNDHSIESFAPPAAPKTGTRQGRVWRR